MQRTFAALMLVAAAHNPAAATATRRRHSVQATEGGRLDSCSPAAGKRADAGDAAHAWSVQRSGVLKGAAGEQELCLQASADHHDVTLHFQHPHALPAEDV